MKQFNFNQVISKTRIQGFVDFMLALNQQIGFKVSSRGWGYIMEQKGIITKDQFDKIEDVINRARRKGMLPVDFVAEEKAREFEEVHRPTTDSYGAHISSWIDAAFDCDSYYEPDWWKGEEYYIQMVVEKIDLVSLFQPLCRKYHIPIANSKGWSSILQRAEYCRRFKRAERRGLKCVLLYCGDHDPDGLRISDTLRKNLEDISGITWGNGERGYDPSTLEIRRFGLDYNFIIENNLTWIDNLITGSGGNLASPKHPNHNLAYVQEYLSTVGPRKCEANALVIAPEAGRQLCEETIIEYLGEDALDRFDERRREVREAIDRVLDNSGARDLLRDAKRAAENFTDEDEDNDDE
jgi:hypothetical protein